MPQREQRGWNRQFTGIELLFIMAILLVLVGVLFPALTRARGRAKQINCLARLRRIGDAAALYARDNKGFFPLDNQNTDRPAGLWTHRLIPYLQPDVRLAFTDPAMPRAFSLRDDTQSHYLFNEEINSRHKGQQSLQVADLVKPTQTMLVICGAQYKRVGGIEDLLAGQLVFPHPNLHHSGIVLFGDGNAKTRRLDQISVNRNVRFWKPEKQGENRGIAP